MSKTKENLVTYVFQCLKLNKYRYKVLRTKNDLEYIKTNIHYVGCNYYGYNHLLVFTKLNNDLYSFFIDRKTLSYSHSTIDLKKVSIKQVKFYVHADLYNGTILDGIFNEQNNVKTFIITDAYMVSGKSFVNIEYKTKLQQIKQDVISHIKTNEKSDDINIIVETPLTYCDLKNITDVENNIIKSRNNINCRGLIFYPRLSGHKFIFTLPPKKKLISESSDDESKAQTLVKKDSSNREHKSGLTVNTNPTVEKANILMKKTNTVDVYDMYLRQTKKKMIKIGIAHVPSTKISKMCKSFYTKDSSDSSDSSEPETKNNDVVVQCEWIQKFKKWQPVIRINNEPDFIDDIYEINSE
jgi:hypothetical protein